MTREEQLACLTDRPCDVCKFHGENGCCKWNCVFEEEPTDAEPLTDKEQRIFLSAMGREEKVCREVDAEHPSENYEDTLLSVCRSITRKVKGALWG